MAGEEHYPRNADTCLRLAQHVEEPDRTRLVDVAATWLRLAEHGNKIAKLLIEPEPVNFTRPPPQQRHSPDQPNN